jgi:hypothetical protein
MTDADDATLVPDGVPRMEQHICRVCGQRCEVWVGRTTPADKAAQFLCPEHRPSGWGGGDMSDDAR